MWRARKFYVDLVTLSNYFAIKPPTSDGMDGDRVVEQIALRYLHIAHGEDQVDILYIAHQLKYIFVSYPYDAVSDTLCVIHNLYFALV